MKFNLRREHLNNGGYDSSGTYWGIGAPLYYYESENGMDSGYIRTSSRETAKEIIKHRHPYAKFYR